MSRRDAILSKARSVASLPSAIAGIMRLLRDSEADIAEIVRAIEHDVSLTSNILRLANSAYFGCPRSVSSVRSAVVRLGSDCVAQLVLASAVAPLAWYAVKGYDLPPGGLWQHSLAVAVGTEQLAAALGIRLPEHAFTAGLMHDVGKILLGTFVQVDADEIMDLAFEEGLSFEVAEREVLGIDHAELGAVVIDGWNLPSDIVEVVRFHHCPDECRGDTLVADLVHTADNLSLMSGIGVGRDGLHYRASGEVVSRLGLTNRVSEAVVCRILSAVEELSALFAGGIGSMWSSNHSTREGGERRWA